MNICRSGEASELTMGQDPRLPSSPQCSSPWSLPGTQKQLCNYFFLRMRELRLQKVTCYSRSPSISSHRQETVRSEPASLCPSVQLLPPSHPFL